MFSDIKEDGKLEAWWLRLTISKGALPLPNVYDINTETLMISYCLWNEDEYDKKLSTSPIINDIPSLKKNSITFPGEGTFALSLSGSIPFVWKSKISKKEFETAYCFMVWADPVGSTAFYDGNNYWKGVLRIDNISSFKRHETNNNSIDHIVELNLNISQGVISYFIDLVEKYSSASFNELKSIHDAIKQGNRDALGKLGVMGPSLGDNDTCIMAGAINSYESWDRKRKGRKEDLYDFDYYNEQRKIAFGPDGGCANETPQYNPSNYTSPFGSYSGIKVKWGQSNISIYDFKTPIKELYAEMIRIGNDGRIYSNEAFSNINWGIIGKQLEISKAEIKNYAALDPRSSSDEHDDVATDHGYEMVSAAALDSDFPTKLDRRILFIQTLKSLRENDLFTCLGAEIYKEEQKAQQDAQQAKRRREAMGDL